MNATGVDDKGARRNDALMVGITFACYVVLSGFSVRDRGDAFLWLFPLGLVVALAVFAISMAWMRNRPLKGPRKQPSKGRAAAEIGGVLSLAAVFSAFGTVLFPAAAVVMAGYSGMFFAVWRTSAHSSDRVAEQHEAV
jgi:hypothetical protein